MKSRTGAILGWVSASILLLGCSDPNDRIQLTMDGWNDLKIGGPASALSEYVGDKTLAYTFGPCTNFQILDGAPRAMNVSVNDSAAEIVEIRIGGVSKVSTYSGFNLDSDLAEVRAAASEPHTYIAVENCTASPIECSNTGDVLIQWDDEAAIPVNQNTTRGMRFENWRSNDGISTISVGDYRANGENICDD